MEWVEQAAARLRDVLAQQWLDAWQPTIAHTPDWALLAAVPTFLSLFALLLRLSWPRRHAFNLTTSAEAPPSSVPKATPERAKSAAGAAPTPTADEEDNRSVRVFVSSTFLDMKAERDELVTRAFPALRAKYRARGVEVFEVDLRWGIIKEQQERGETLPTLLAEIDRCRPYFIGLLGDRYGWVPPSEALTDELKAAYPAIADAEGASVTAMEIMHGVLSNPASAERACFFERDPSWDWMATLNDADRATAITEPDAACVRLGALKALIRQRARVESYARPEDIRQKVTDALDALLEARFPEAEPPDAFEQSLRLHRAYARDRRILHVGATEYLRDLDRWMETKDAPPTLITGASGGGKSTLVANWVNAWRNVHPESRALVFEHYLGASPDSADPMLLMRRLWQHLNRASGETIDPPDAKAELMDVAAGLTQRLAQARATTARRGGRLLIVLDGLDKLASEKNLRWLPIVPGVHVLASSLDSEAKSAALARGFFPIEVKPLTQQDGQEFIAGTLARWRRRLEPQHIARILQPAAAELAGSPLYLKTVLEELRVSADNAHLVERLDDYRGALHMANLFDRVLARLEEDCGLGLVAKALPLIWASRTGLEEAEILAISGASPLAWATLRNGLGDGLRDQQGRLAFGHDFLSQAVAERYLMSDEAKRTVHLSIANRFETREPDERQAEELPFQLRAAAQLGDEDAWQRLEALLIDLSRFELLRGRGDNELWGHWRQLQQNRSRDPEFLLCSVFEARAGEASRWTVDDADIATSLCEFLEFAGAYGASRSRVQQQLAAASERLFGPDHPNVAADLNNLAELLHATNRYAEAEPLFRRALKIDEANFGPDSATSAVSLNNLAALLDATNRHTEAEPLFRRSLAIAEASFGSDHPHVVTSLSNLAELLRTTNRPAEAEALLLRALKISEASFGPDHPDVAMRLNNLGLLLAATNRQAEAEPFLRRALKADEASFGPDHPNVAIDLNNLAELLRATNRHAEAEPLFRRALKIDEASFGPDHPNVATVLNNLAEMLRNTNRHAEAEPLFRRVVRVFEAGFGPDHPNVAASLNNLGGWLYISNRHAEAEPLLLRALKISEASFGPDHPNVATGLNNVASLLHTTNRHAEAEPLYRRALAIMESSYGVTHPSTETVAKSLATCMAEMRKP